MVVFGNTPGDITVTAATASLTARFTLTNSVPVGSFLIVSGNSQSAPINAAFGQPLVVRATNSGGGPLAGVTVRFTATAGVTLSAPSATTDSSGTASVQVTAGSTVGAASVVATLGASSVTFSLNVGAAGPSITSIVDAAGFGGSVTPCSLATIRGSGFSSGLTGMQMANPILGPWPTTLAGVSVTVSGVLAPIQSVSNIAGSEQINFQVPCETPAGTQQVTVGRDGTGTSGNATVAPFAPGLFTWTNLSNVNQVVAIRPDGSYVTPANPARWNERITVFATGLPAPAGLVTNAVGQDQPVPASQIVIGVNNQGASTISAQYARNLVGVYTVVFTIDPALGTGNALNFAIAVVNSAGGLTFGNGTTIPVAAQ